MTQNLEIPTWAWDVIIEIGFRGVTICSYHLGIIRLCQLYMSTYKPQLLLALESINTMLILAMHSMTRE